MQNNSYSISVQLYIRIFSHCLCLISVRHKKAENFFFICMPSEIKFIASLTIGTECFFFFRVQKEIFLFFRKFFFICNFSAYFFYFPFKMSPRNAIFACKMFIKFSPSIFSFFSVFCITIDVLLNYKQFLLMAKFIGLQKITLTFMHAERSGVK